MALYLLSLASIRDWLAKGGYYINQGEYQFETGLREGAIFTEVSISLRLPKGGHFNNQGKHQFETGLYLLSLALVLYWARGGHYIY